MKKHFLITLSLWATSACAQIQQNIQTVGGTTSNSIADIDSIRFNAAGDVMEVVLQNGAVDVHPLADITSVNFSSASDCVPLPLCDADSVLNETLTYGTMTDQDGVTYKTIIIGTQEWMAQNLNACHYRNGDPIGSAEDDTQWYDAGDTDQGAWCYYDYNAQNECPYGKMYNWFAVSDPRNVCPTGWHVPSDAEWTTMINFLDPNADGGFNGNNVGGKLKSAGTAYWLTPNAQASNELGFSALPGGRVDEDGSFDYQQILGYWWSSTDSGGGFPIWRSMDYSGEAISYGTNNSAYGYSVRCIRD